MISEEKMKIIINNYFKEAYNENTAMSIEKAYQEAFEEGFRAGVRKGQYLKSERQIGKWTYDSKDEYYGDWYICSVCGRSSIRNNYCPYCGAKMEI